MYCVYVISNEINNKLYVGRTCNYRKRWLDHKSTSRLIKDGKKSRGDKGVQLIHLAVAKHGVENFNFKIIENNILRSNINERECFWIDQFDSMNKDFGYNIIRGDIVPGYSHSIETKNKISESQKGKIITREQRRKISESRLKAISESKDSTNYKPWLGKKRSQETKEKISKTKSGRPNLKIRKFSLEEEMDICKEYEKGNVTSRELGAKFGCGKSTILRILKRHDINFRLQRW
ncbi:MAG: GIY-YIG nuclease family protein [Pelagibacterales bacterium]|nr:GIY-YIG nuclease family protein [Pelagibacterales bacterium]